MLKKNIITYFLILFSLFFFSLQIYLDRYFGVVDFEQFIVFLSFGVTGLLDSDDYIIIKFIQICILLPLAITFILYLLTKLTYFFNKIYLVNKILSITKKANIYLSFLFLIISVLFFLKSISFDDFISRDNKGDFIRNNYVKPNLKDFLDAETTKDLILIYVESMEDVFLNKEFISESSIKKFQFDELGAKKFKKFKPTKYTNWTTGSIVATQCGIPQKPVGIFDTQNMKLNRNKPNKFGIAMKNFLPNALCMGNLLKAFNYKNVFINAVDLNFAATGLFFKEHGYDEIYGKKYFKKSNYDYDSYTWGGGPNDSVLFNFAKSKIVNFKQNRERFNVTILTTDTHEPGFVNNKCTSSMNTNYNRLSKALVCTSESLFNFVKFVENNFSEDTAIVIFGDHLYPKLLDLNLNNTGQERTIYNRIISKNFSIYRDLINHYDLFPTILNLLNFSFKNNRLGLGFSAVKSTDINNYHNYFKDLQKNIQNKSDYYIEFWK
tara:strand:+ start:939 stop:2417 length:1479 start_codon:yes stop_codon:yes gene_type:complete